MERWIAMAAAVLAAGCVDKVSEDARPCPCGDDRICCFDVCLEEGTSCTSTEATIGLAGGTLTAPNGATLEIPFGALEEDTVIRMRSVQPEQVEGIKFLGGAVALEPELLALGAEAVLTMPFDVDLVPAGTDPDAVLMHRAPAATRVYQPIHTEVTATTMQVTVPYLMMHVPAVKAPEECQFSANSGSSGCWAEVPIGDTNYRVECPWGEGDPNVVAVTCRCLEDGVETGTVEVPCGFAAQVWVHECGFPCPGSDPPVVPDAGTVTADAAPPI